MSGDSGVAGEGRVVGVQKFHSWGKCTMALTNINSDWMSNASSGLCIILFILHRPFKLHLGGYQVFAHHHPWYFKTVML